MNEEQTVELENVALNMLNHLAERDAAGERELAAAISAAVASISASYAAGNITLADQDAALAAVTGLGAASGNIQALIAQAQGIASTAQKPNVEGRMKDIIAEMLEHDVEMYNAAYEERLSELSEERQAAIRRMNEVISSGDPLETVEEKSQFVSDLTTVNGGVQLDSPDQAAAMIDASGVDVSELTEEDILRAGELAEEREQEACEAEEHLDSLEAEGATEAEIATARSVAADRRAEATAGVEDIDTLMNAEASIIRLSFDNMRPAQKQRLLDEFDADGVEGLSDAELRAALLASREVISARPGSALSNAAATPGTDEHALTQLVAGVAVTQMMKDLGRERDLTPAQMVDRVVEEYAELFPEGEMPNEIREAMTRTAVATRTAVRENPELLNADNETLAREAARIARESVDASIRAASAAMRGNAEGALTEAQNEARNDRRHEEGISFLEMEFEDVQHHIMEYANGRNLGIEGMDAAQMIQMLEDSGVIADNGNENNRQTSGVGRQQAVRDKLFGDENDWTEFGDWNDESVARLDIDGDEQIDGLEALDAIRIASTLNEMSAAEKREFNAAIGGLGDVTGTDLAKHDINGDGRLDAAEVVRVMQNNNLTYDDMNEVSELRQVLPDAASASELGR